MNEELKKKLAELAGLERIYKATNGGWYYYEYQEGENKPIPNFPESLDACFELLVPKAIDKLADIDLSTSTEAYYKLFEMWLKQAENSEVNALALCLAIEKLLEVK